MHRHPQFLARATFACCVAVLIATAPGIPVVWDETEYMFRAQLIREWPRFDHANFSSEVIREHWLFISYAEGHPAGFILPIVLGQILPWPFLADPVTEARLGPIILFSVACAALAVHLRRQYGLVAAVIAPAALLTFPRIFSEAHFATQDGQLTAWWLLLWIAQSSPSLSAAKVGLLLGLTTATKFTGWLTWGPFAFSEVLLHRRLAVRRMLIAVPIALLLFYVVNPPLWHNPVTGIVEHFNRNLNRASTLNIGTVFLGEMYDVESPLPWYNTLAWLVMVAPVPTLLFGVVGLSHSLRKPTPWSIALFLHWVTMMVGRALPGAPPHDGVRLFLPALGFWCVYAGIGAQVAFTAFGRLQKTSWRLALQAALVLAFLTNTIDLIRYYPQTLSHYSPMVGGLRGAAALGMEPAYWWDALDADVLRWINERTTPGEAIAFSPIYNTAALHHRGLQIPKDVDPQRNRFQWYVLQNRPGLFGRVDRTLMRRGEPAFVKYAGRSKGSGAPRDMEVPLISIFSFDQYSRARRR